MWYPHQAPTAEMEEVMPQAATQVEVDLMLVGVILEEVMRAQV
jgi:hypothetical protein